MSSVRAYFKGSPMLTTLHLTSRELGKVRFTYNQAHRVTHISLSGLASPTPFTFIPQPLLHLCRLPLSPPDQVSSHSLGLQSRHRLSLHTRVRLCYREPCGSQQARSQRELRRRVVVALVWDGYRVQGEWARPAGEGACQRYRGVVSYHGSVGSVLDDEAVPGILL